MFSQQYLPYISAVSRIGKDSQTSCRIVALAVAAAVAATLPLPSASVDSPVAFFQAQGAMEAQQRLGEYNEAAVVDCRLAIDLVQKFWMLRYNTAHSALSPIAVDGSFFTGFTGAARLLAPDDIVFMDANAREILTIFNAAIACWRAAEPQVSSAPVPTDVSEAQTVSTSVVMR